MSIYRRLLGNSNQFCWLTTHYSVAAADRLAWATMVPVSPGAGIGGREKTMGAPPLQVRPRFLEMSSFCVVLWWSHHTMPCAIMALATFMNPATFAPFS